jgi:hypothetical protein
MALPAIFISYNPSSDIEQTLAIRLHTIGAVHGYNTLLPDRKGFVESISTETKSRILIADFFILFSTTSISLTVLNEIEVASTKFNDKSKILVIYDSHVGKNLSGTDKFTEVYINRSAPIDEILNVILTKLKSLQNRGDDQNGFLSALGAILLTGIGLFALSSMLDKPTKRKKPLKTRSQVKKVSKARG